MTSINFEEIHIRNYLEIVIQMSINPENQLILATLNTAFEQANLLFKVVNSIRDSLSHDIISNHQTYIQSKLEETPAKITLIERRGNLISF